MSTIIFIRHAETDLAGSFCGHSDPELNASGEQQLIQLVETVGPLGIERLLSSDLRRAAKTATAIGQRIGIKVEFRPDLREIYFGQWEGRNWPEIEEGFPLEASRWIEQYPSVAAPGGETYAEFSVRIDAVLAPILVGATNERMAIVTHRGVMHYALTRFFQFGEEEAWTKTAAYGSVVIAAAGPPESGESRAFASKLENSLPCGFDGRR